MRNYWRIGGTLACLTLSACGSSPSGVGNEVTGPFVKIRANSAASQVCVVNGSGAAGCLGRNQYGQLGGGNTTETTSHMAVVRAVSGLSSGVADIAVGGYHACALMTGGTVKCWGYNQYGALGNGSTTQSTSPVSVSGLANISQVATGSYHTCALNSAGAVYCWGSNTDGRLGLGTGSGQFSTPQAVPTLTSGVSRIYASADGNCALKSDATLWCWGRIVSTSNAPTDSGATNVAQASLGGQHACLVTTAGAVMCAGANGFGQLGNCNGGTPPSSCTNSASFLAVTGFTSGAAAVVSMEYSSCARKTSGEVFCWGANGSYQIGSGSQTPTPRQIDVSSAKLIVSGSNFMLAAFSDGSVKSWGSNLYSTLAAGASFTTEKSATPVTASQLSWDASQTPNDG